MNRTTIEKIFNNDVDGVYIPLNNRKEPLTTWKNKTREELKHDIDVLLEKKDTIHGLGFVIPENTIVLDFDVYINTQGIFYNSCDYFKSFIDWSELHTKVVKTGSNGRHIYFHLKQMKDLPRKYNTDNIRIDIQKKGNYVITPKSMYGGCKDTKKCKNCFENKGQICQYKSLLYEQVNDLPIMEIDLDDLPAEIQKDISTILKLPMPMDEKDEKYIEKDDDEDNEDDDEYTGDKIYNLTIEQWGEFINTLEPLSDGSYDTWNTTMICLYNIFEKCNERDNMIHDFSSLSRKYKRRETQDKIKSYKDNREFKYKLKKLLTLCAEHDIDTSIFKHTKSVKSLSIYEKMSEYVYSDYYIHDFIKELLAVEWNKGLSEHDDRDELKDFINSNIHKVMFIQYGVNGHYLKLDNDELDKPSKVIIGANIKYVKWFWIEVKQGKTTEMIHKRCEIPVNSILNEYSNCLIRCNKFLVDPNPNYILNDRVLNLWTGFKSKPVIEYNIQLIQPILDHIFIVWCDRNEEYYIYLLNWLKHIYTKPHIKTKVAVVLQSTQQQIGKGILINRFFNPFLFGEKCSSQFNNLNLLTERFNKHLMNQIFVNIDELSSIESNHNFHAQFNIIKNLISDPTFRIEIKGGENFKHKQYMNFIMTTNNIHTIKLEESDARYFVLQCNPEKYGDIKYFNELDKSLNQEVANHFAKYLIDYNNIINIQQIPMTTLKAQMIDAQKDSVKQFLEYIDENNDFMEEMDHNDGWIKASDLFIRYKYFCSENNCRTFSSKVFGMLISNTYTKKKSSHIMYNLYQKIN